MFYLVRIIVVDVIIEFRGVVKGIVNEKYKMFDENFVNLDILEFMFFLMKKFIVVYYFVWICNGIDL